MRLAILIWFILFTIFWISMMIPAPKMRWAQGWLIPHRVKQEKCFFKCGTCVPQKEQKDGIPQDR